jgi:NhaA family Na+:H+ antiporter
VWTRARAVAQKYSLPLLAGVLVALVFANAAPDAYTYVAGLDHHGPHLDLAGGSGFTLMGHALTLHFLVNDIFMVFFFGLAAKEVTEALLPGGALSPFKKAMSPLLATMVRLWLPAAHEPPRLPLSKVFLS